MKQLITVFFLSVATLLHAQNDSIPSLEGTWYISMIGVNMNDTTLYKVPKEKCRIIIGDRLEQKADTRYYISSPQPFYLSYTKYSNGRKGILSLYETKKKRRKRSKPIEVEYLTEKNKLILVETETIGISSEYGSPVYDKLTILTRTYDSLSWNKRLLGSWNYSSSKSFFELKPGDTCRFTKTDLWKESTLSFSLNSGIAICKIKKNQDKPFVQSNGILDGIYLANPWMSLWYDLSVEKREITLSGSLRISFKIIELNDQSLILIKQ